MKRREKRSMSNVVTVKNCLILSSIYIQTACSNIFMARNWMFTVYYVIRTTQWQMKTKCCNLQKTTHKISVSCYIREVHTWHKLSREGHSRTHSCLLNAWTRGYRSMWATCHLQPPGSIHPTIKIYFMKHYIKLK